MHRLIHRFRRKALSQSLEGGIIVITGRHIRADQGVHFFSFKCLYWYYTTNLQFSIRNSSGFIKTERIHMSQGLQRVDILHKDLHSGQADYACRQGHGNQQHSRKQRVAPGRASHSLPFFMEYQKMIAQILSSCRADPCAHHRKQQIGGQIVKYAYQKKIRHGAEQGYRAEPQEAHGHQKGITNRMKMSSPVFIFIDRLNGNLPDFTALPPAVKEHILLILKAVPRYEKQPGKEGGRKTSEPRLGIPDLHSGKQGKHFSGNHISDAALFRHFSLESTASKHQLPAARPDTFRHAHNILYRMLSVAVRRDNDLRSSSVFLNPAKPCLQRRSLSPVLLMLQHSAAFLRGFLKNTGARPAASVIYQHNAIICPLPQPVNEQQKAFSRLVGRNQHQNSAVTVLLLPHKGCH